ncbi:hypothetical protein ES703_62289 [subsurface metagenome]
MDTGYRTVHVLGHTSILEHDDSHHHRHFEVLNTPHKLFKGGRLVDGLRLHKLSAGFDLLFQLNNLWLDFLGTGRNAATLEELRCAVEFVGVALHIPAHVGAGLKFDHRLQESHGVEIKHGFGFRMVAHGDVVTCQGEGVFDSKRGGGKQVHLKSDTVAVAAGHLKNRLNAAVQQHPGHRHRANTHYSRLAISDVHRGYRMFKVS